MCGLMFITSCNRNDEYQLEQPQQSDELLAKISLDDIIATNPNVSQIKIIGNDKDISVITDQNNISSKTTISSYSLGWYKSIIVTRLTKSAVQGKNYKITVIANNGSKNGCNDYPPQTLPIVEKVGWNNNNLTVLQSVQVNANKTFYQENDAAGCNLTSKPYKKQGTINQYDAGAYQEVGWKIRTNAYSSSFQVLIDVY